MGRSVIGLCAAFGALVGGYVPTLWGAGSLSVSSLLFSFVGCCAGVRLGLRVSES